jgi:predicted RNA-binding Zn-ribbon protein involved in translation (DUF1610 family)
LQPNNGDLVKGNYTTCACTYCGHEMQYQRIAEGTKAECPHCGRVIHLGVDRLKSALSLHEIKGQRLRRSRRTSLRKFALVLGWPLFLSGLLTLVGMTLMPFDPGRYLQCLLTLVLSFVATTFGLMLLMEGRRTQSYWVCSLCEQRLGNGHDLMCPNCHGELGRAD